MAEGRERGLGQLHREEPGERDGMVAAQVGWFTRTIPKAPKSGAFYSPDYSLCQTEKKPAKAPIRPRMALMTESEESRIMPRLSRAAATASPRPAW